MKLKQIKSFLELQTLFDKMKNIRRETRVVGRVENENDAEHSWHVAMWALVLLRDLTIEIDISKVIEMLLIHDLPEIYCGDKLLFSKTEADEKDEYNAAAILFFEDFPTPLGDELYFLWLEFTKGISKEAQVARAIDYLQPILQNVNSNGFSWKKNGITLDKVVSRKQSGICIDPALTEIFNELIDRAAKIMKTNSA